MFKMTEWRKASASGSNGCVEVKEVAGTVFVRNSKEPDGYVLKFTTYEWERFLDGARKGEFD